MTDVADFIIEHHGVKGMHWGIRNERKPTGFRAKTSSLVIDETIHSSTVAGAKEVADLISNRYGFSITEVKDLKVERPKEYKHGTAAYVEFTPGKKGGVVFVRPEDIRADLHDSEKNGWMRPGTTNVRGLLTHESAHAMFHADQKTGNIEARNKAMEAAGKQAAKDHISGNEILSKISGYAAYSGSREEAEAEMFSQYHWGTNTPNFINVWGQTLHQEMGIDPTPFKKAVNHG